MPGSAEGQSLHIPAKPELRPSVTTQWWTPPPSGTRIPPRIETSDLLSVRSSRLGPDVAEPDCRSALEVFHIFSGQRGRGEQSQNRPQISNHGDQTVTTNLPAESPRAAVKQHGHTLSPGLLHTRYQRHSAYSNHSSCCLHGSS